jgi:hypothetical protein
MSKQILGLPSAAFLCCKAVLFYLPVAFVLGIMIGMAGLIVVPALQVMGAKDGWDPTPYLKWLEV